MKCYLRLNTFTDIHVYMKYSFACVELSQITGQHSFLSVIWLYSTLGRRLDDWEYPSVHSFTSFVRVGEYLEIFHLAVFHHILMSQAVMNRVVMMGVDGSRWQENSLCHSPHKAAITRSGKLDYACERATIKQSGWYRYATMDSPQDHHPHTIKYTLNLCFLNTLSVAD